MNNEKEIKVTGERLFGSGAKRDPNSNKGRYDLLSPIFIRRLAVHTQKGGKVRGDRNWEAGMPMDAVLDSAIRHMFNYLEGDRSEDHLAAAAWNVMNLIHTEEQIERGNLSADLAKGLPDYTKSEPDFDKMWNEVFKDKQIEYPFPYKVVPVDENDMYADPEDVDQYTWTDNPNPALVYSGDMPYEHYDCVPSPEVAEKHELERCCENCIDSSPVGGPVPLSRKCEACRRLSNWRSKI
jgi:hypothetical protein